MSNKLFLLPILCLSLFPSYAANNLLPSNKLAKEMENAIYNDDGNTLRTLITTNPRLDVNAPVSDVKPPLHTCCYYGSLECVECLSNTAVNWDLQQGEDLGHTPLTWCCSRFEGEAKRLNCFENEKEKEKRLNNIALIAELLLKHKADPNKANKWGNSPLSYMLMFRDFGMMKAFCGSKEPAELIGHLLKKGLNIDATSSNGSTLLHIAAQGGHAKAIEKLIKLGLKVNKKNNEGKTALHKACWYGHINSVKVLVANGADLTAITNKGYTALYFAKQRWNTDIVQYLENYQVTELLLPYVGGEGWIASTILFYAVPNPKRVPPSEELTKQMEEAICKGDKNKLEMLIKTNPSVDLNAKDKNGETFLHKACWYGHVDCVKILVLSSADLAATTEKRETAFSLAKQKNHEEVMQYFKKLQQGWGWQRMTFFEAAEDSNLDMLKLFKAKGADVTQRNESNENALHYACKNGSRETITWLIEDCGLSIDARGFLNMTPFLLAAYYGNIEALEVLAKKGANVNAKDQDGKTALDLANIAFPYKKEVISYLEKI